MINLLYYCLFPPLCLLKLSNYRIYDLARELLLDSIQTMLFLRPYWGITLHLSLVILLFVEVSHSSCWLDLICTPVNDLISYSYDFFRSQFYCEKGTSLYLWVPWLYFQIWFYLVYLLDFLSETYRRTEPKIKANQKSDSVWRIHLLKRLCLDLVSLSVLEPNWSPESK